MAPDGRARPNALPTVVVVGSASRDLTPEDPRGWRLGGGVTYGALALARLGMTTGALIGLDPIAMDAEELDTLRSAGVQIVPVPLEYGPVFLNEETPQGRVQTAVSVSDLVPQSALPEAWRAARGWLIAPVAGELADAWSEVPADQSCVALGWQGLLRRLRAGERVHRRDPFASALVARASVIGVSVDDLPAAWSLAALDGLAGSGAEVLVTAGSKGGALLRLPLGRRELLRYSAVGAGRLLDATGAGDVALAVLLAACMATPNAADRDGWAASRRRQLLLVAAAASLSVEQPGIHGVPSLGAIRDLLASRHAGAQSA